MRAPAQKRQEQQGVVAWHARLPHTQTSKRRRKKVGKQLLYVDSLQRPRNVRSRHAPQPRCIRHKGARAPPPHAKGCAELGPNGGGRPAAASLHHHPLRQGPGRRAAATATVTLKMGHSCTAGHKIRSLEAPLPSGPPRLPLLTPTPPPPLPQCRKSPQRGTAGDTSHPCRAVERRHATSPVVQRAAHPEPRAPRTGQAGRLALAVRGPAPRAAKAPRPRDQGGGGGDRQRAQTSAHSAQEGPASGQRIRPMRHHTPPNMDGREPRHGPLSRGVEGANRERQGVGALAMGSLWRCHHGDTPCAEMGDALGQAKDARRLVSPQSSRVVDVATQATGAAAVAHLEGWGIGWCSQGLWSHVSPTAAGSPTRGTTGGNYSSQVGAGAVSVPSQHRLAAAGESVPRCQARDRLDEGANARCSRQSESTSSHELEHLH